MNFVATCPNLCLSGANQAIIKFFAGFHEYGHDAQWIVTSHREEEIPDWLDSGDLNIRALVPTSVFNVARRQQQLVDVLEKKSPALYFPNFDNDMLWMASDFPQSSRTVFVVHSDDPEYYATLATHGEFFDAIVAVSRFIVAEISRRFPRLAERVHFIPYGVDVPAYTRKPKRNDEPLTVIYCGRIVEEQKEVSDLADLIMETRRRGLPVVFKIAGGGTDEESFFHKIASALEDGTAEKLGVLRNSDVATALQESDVFTLTSSYEGLPVSLLEAMAAGCIPLVTDVDSGIPDIVRHQENGFRHPIHDPLAMVDELERLCADRDQLNSLSTSAYQTIKTGPFNTNQAVESYLEMSEKLLQAPQIPRPRRRTTTPPQYRIGPRIRHHLKYLRPIHKMKKLYRILTDKDRVHE